MELKRFKFFIDLTCEYTETTLFEGNRVMMLWYILVLVSTLVCVKQNSNVHFSCPSQVFVFIPNMMGKYICFHLSSGRGLVCHFISKACFDFYCIIMNVLENKEGVFD